MCNSKITFVLAAAVAALALGFAHTARADFTGPYAPANWTFDNSGGAGFFTNDGTTLIITGDDDANGGPVGGETTRYYLNAAASGTWSFHWSYTSVDTGDWDHAGYQLGGLGLANYHQLAINDQSGISGDVSIAVSAGQLIGFSVWSGDGAYGPGILTITNFVGPVPAPGALALLGVAGFFGTRRRRRA